MQRNNPKYQKLSKQQQHYVDLIERSFWVNEKSWSSKVKKKVYRDLEIMVEKPNSTQGIALWNKTQLMHGVSGTSDSKTEQNGSRTPDFLEGFDPELTDDSFELDSTSNSSPLPVTRMFNAQPQESENQSNRLANQTLLDPRRASEETAFREARQREMNLAIGPRPIQVQAPGTRPILFVPMHPGLPPSRPQSSRVPQPVFSDVPEEAGGGEEIRTIYCGLNALNKPPNAIFGNPLQCLRKGYNIGRGHIRT